MENKPKSLIGRKVKGLEFENLTDGVGYTTLSINKVTGKVGVITSYYVDSECEYYEVNFNGYDCSYPASLIEQHLVDENEKQKEISMENKLKNLKFRVHSEAHSKAIQEKLFSMDEDVKWLDTGRQVINQTNHLFVNENKKIFTLHNNDELYFNENLKKDLFTLDDLYKMEAEKNCEISKEIETLKKRLEELESKLK